MDATIRLLERRALEDPTDDAVAGHLVRALARAGKSREARRVARSRFAAGRVDAETIATVLEVGGELIEGRDRPETPRANVGYVVGRAGARAQGFAEIVPTIAFASIPGAGARENALALRDLFGVQDLFVQRADDEAIVDFSVPLASPWHVARTYAVRTIRIVTVPVTPDFEKLRQQLLTATSALCFVVDARSDGDGPRSNELAFRTIARDFRKVRGFAVDELPLAVQYVEPVEDAWHRALAVALGLRRVARAHARIETTAPEADDRSPRFARVTDEDRIASHEGVAETLAYLLSGVASGVRGVAAPRPRFTGARAS
jgi:hypothetical protein